MLIYATLSEANENKKDAIKECNELFDCECQTDVQYYNNNTQNRLACDICESPLKNFSTFYLCYSCELKFKKIDIECDKMNFYRLCPDCFNNVFNAAEKMKGGKQC